jgi:tetratricopeptide (TPR) repeat protein
MLASRLTCGAVLAVVAVAGWATTTSRWDSARVGPSVVRTSTECASSPACDGMLAKAKYQHVVNADPNDRYGWYNLGVLAQGSGDSNAAQTDFLKAIAIDPNFEASLYEEGLVRYHANDVPGAVSYLSRAVVANPQDACAHWALGIALMRSDGRARSERGLTELRTALKVDPALIRSVSSAKVKPNQVPGCN